MITVTTPPATTRGNIFRLGIIYLVVPFIGFVGFSQLFGWTGLF
ncbi:MAG: hypothetical protein Ct9H300mP11_13710 [Chloroflexota bacterium]|nr:MAG: hypothetical protein Ct9H300mP11_13710 [Chloroflexota bacterium]